MSKLLFDKQPVVIDRDLAKSIGLNESIVLQQIHYWIQNNSDAEKNYHDGYYWTYNSIQKWWEEHFDFWSLDTVKRIFKSLENMGLLLTGNYNKDSRDRTKWYTIDYKKLEDIRQCISANCPNGKVQNAPMRECKMPQPLPENTTENTTKDIYIEQDGYQQMEESEKVQEEVSVTKVSRRTNSVQVPYDEIVETYNSICVSMPKVSKITSQRKKSISARWTECNDMNIYISLFTKAEKSDFLSGRDGKWTACNFDWLLNSQNMLKVMEGNYDNRQNAQRQSSQKQTAGKTSTFNNFKQREYDYDDLKKKLLGWK